MRKKAKDEDLDAASLFNSQPAVVRQLIPKKKTATIRETRRRENDDLLRKVRRGDIVALLAFFAGGVEGSPFRPLPEKGPGISRVDKLSLRVASAMQERHDPLFSEEERHLFDRIAAIDLRAGITAETSADVRRTLIEMGVAVGRECGRPLRATERHLLSDMLVEAAAATGRTFTGSDRTLTVAVLSETETALTDIVRCNSPLVKSIANRFRGRGLAENDLLQVGSMGLLKAAKMFRFEAKAVLSTYAVLWIKQAIEREIETKNYDIRRPVHTCADNLTVYRTISYLEQRLLRPPTDEEVAVWLEVTPEQARAGRNEAKIGFVSLGAEIRSEDGAGQTMSEVIPDPRTALAGWMEQMTHDERRRQSVMAAIDRLPERERTVIQATYFNGLTLQEASAGIGRFTKSGIASREWVRQIEQKALALIHEDLLRQGLIESNEIGEPLRKNDAKRR